MIEGTLAKPGGGKGKPPPFRVTVPSVDVDWKGFAGHLDEQGKDIDENGEDARHIVVPLNTNNASDIRCVLLQSPFDDDEREGRPIFPYGEPVHPDISIGWDAAGVLGLLRIDGTSRIQMPNPWRINAKDFDNPRQWPLKFGVAPLQATKSFTIIAEGQEDDVKDKALDRIHGRVVNVDIDVDSDYDGDIDDDDESLETTQGGIMCAGGENLAEIKLAIAPNLTQLPGKLTLSATAGGNRIKVWQDERRTTELVLPKIWRDVAQIPGTLYVEGLEASAAMRDVELKLEYDETPAGTPQDSQYLFKCSDVIKLTFVKLVSIRFKRPSMDKWRTVDEIYKFLGAFASQKSLFGVDVIPNNAILPKCLVSWGGLASGNGVETEVHFISTGMFHPITASISKKTVSVAVSVRDKPDGIGDIAFAAEHPVQAAIAKRHDLIGASTSNLEPFKWAYVEYPGNQLNTVADAARHAYWSCLLSRYTGSWFALGLTTAHESSGNGPSTETVMDLHNNEIGISLSSHSHDDGLSCCREAVKNAVQSGMLWYLDISHGNSNVKEDALLQPSNKP